MKLTKLWFLLLFFNVFINLSPVVEWMETSSESSQATINPDVCENAQISSSTNHSENKKFFAYLTQVGLGSSILIDQCYFQEDNNKLPQPLSLQFNKSILKLYTQLFFLSQGSRAPPKA